jgi:hypothetical protein
MIAFQRDMDRVVSSFVEQVTELARRAAIEQVQRALGAASMPRTQRSRMDPGAKRAPDELDRLRDQFVAFVSSNPGLRIEQINQQLGTSTKDLALPIRKLIAEGTIKTKGKKRSTTYFAK